VTRYPPRSAYLVGVMVLWLVRPVSAAAQPICHVEPRRTEIRRSWTPPLDRLVSLHTRDVSLREALDGVAAAAGVRLSYSEESLPLGRSVCLSVDSLSMGDALTDLLKNAPIKLVVVAKDHVVLVPAMEPRAATSEPVVLDRVVVTGSAVGTTRRQLSVAVDVLNERDLAVRTARSLSDALDGAVPGLWMWEQSPSSFVTQFGSIRGASSLGVSHPKVYIDGIEVANPLLITSLTPEAVDHVEVIRGPQGTALYGADAISGVTNIITRFPTGAVGESPATLRGGLGLAASHYGTTPTLTQDHALTVQAGSNIRAAAATMEFKTTGAFTPGAYARTVNVTSAVRRVTSRSILTGTFRFFGDHASTAVSPLLAGALPASVDSSLPPQSETAYTAGMSAKFMQNGWLQHSLVLGVDGYSLTGVPDDGIRIPTADASALAAAEGAAARGTVRVSSVGTFGVGERASLAVTLGAEQSLIRQRSQQDAYRGPDVEPVDEQFENVVSWRGSTGLFSQINGQLLQHIYVTGGFRFERDAAGDGMRWATLPMLGMSVVADRGPVTVKLRGAYGKGIRWPDTPLREAFDPEYRTEHAGTEPLAPEEQSGVEGGFDLLVGNTMTLSMTRFSQAASGLIQRVTLPGDSLVANASGVQLDYDLQNVGEVSNRGWELQGSLRGGPFALAGSFSRVDSRVRNLAAGYTGDLRAGDPMLQVPARMFGATVSWSGARWSAAVTLRRAEDWINYDRLALAEAFAAAESQPSGFVGSNLREYWRQYPGVTHLRAAAAFAMAVGLTVTVTVDNVLNRQIGEPDNITVLPGRTAFVGFRWHL
jgi:iron complex outermembrane recepter protein